MLTHAAHRSAPAALFASLIVLGVGAPAFAGDLNPPPGPIEPTMKSLDALAPGQCLNMLPGAPDAVHVITEPGHYVLTDDIVVPAGKSGVVVELNAALGPGEYPISIDIRGHTITGQAGSVHAIDVRADAGGVVKRFGIGDTTPSPPLGISSMGGSGVHADGVEDVTVSSVHVSQCGAHGIECSSSSRLRLTDVEVSSCTLDGVHLSSVARCELDVSVTQCGGDGIEASLCPSVSYVAIKTKGTGADKNRVAQCGGNGVLVTDCDDVELLDLDVSACTLDGVHVTGADECRVRLRVTDCDGDGMEVSNGRRLSACCIGSSGEDGVETTVARCNGNGVLVSNVTDIELAVRVEQCTLDGIHVSTFDECRLHPVVKDVSGDGLDISNGRRLSACCIGSSGEDGVEVLLARCDANGALVSNVDEVTLSLRVEQCLLDGVHVTNALQCTVGGEFVDCGGDGVEGDGCVLMAIGSKGMPTSSRPKSKSKSSAHRVVNPGGNGVLLTNCTHVSIDDLECSDAVLDGVHVDSSLLAGASSSVWLHSVSALRCGGDAMECSSEPTGSVDAVACVASQCSGDGLHVSGAARVSVSDWRDNDCDDDGIDIAASAVSGSHIRVEGALSVSAGSAGLRLLGATQPVSGELLHVTVRDAFANAIDARNSLQLGRLAVEDCLLTGSGGDGLSCDRFALRLLRLACDDNAACGARVTSSDSVSAEALHAENNGAEGMRVTGLGAGKVSMQDFHFTSNGFAVPGGASGLSIESVSSVQCRNGECRSNAGDGIRLADFDRDGVLDLVVCSSNVGSGVHAVSAGGLPLGRCRVTNAMCDNNGGDGVTLEATTGGEVAQCTVTNNAGVGVAIFGNGHVVRSNACTSNGGGALLVPVPGNVVGPLVDELTVGGNCNPAANYVY